MLLSFFQLLFVLVGGSLVACGVVAEAKPEPHASTLTVIGRRPIKNVPVESSEFTGDSVLLKDQSGKSISSVLRQMPSVLSRSAGGEGGEPEFLLRGQDPIQSRYFVEGVSLNDAQYNYGQVALVPLESVERVDCYPAGVPVYLAEDGLGGAVHFRLGSWEDKKSSTEFGTRIGSFDYVKVYGVDKSSSRLRWHVQFVRSAEDFIYFDDYGTPFNKSDDRYIKRKHNQFMRFSLLPRISLVSLPNYSLSLFSLNAYGETDIPGPVYLPVEGELTQWFSLTGLKSNWHFGRAQLNSQLYFRGDWQRLRGEEKFASPAFRMTDSNNLGAGLKNRFVLRVLAPHQVHFVMGLNWNGFRTSVQENQYQSNRRWHFPLGTTVNLSLLGGDLIISPALLYSYYQYELASFDGVTQVPRQRHYALTSPRLGLSYRVLPELQLRSSLGSYHRAPSMSELFGSPYGIMPSYGLVYEEADKGEWGIDWGKKYRDGWLRKLRLSYTYSFSRASNLISYIQNSQQTQVAVNIGRSQIQTHELTVEGESDWGVGLLGSFSFYRTENLSDVTYWYGKTLPNRPNYQGEVTVFYQGNRWQIRYHISLFGSVYSDLVNLNKRQPLVEHGIGAEWQTKQFGQFSVDVQNLTNVITSTSRLGAFQAVENTTGYPGYPSPGRRFYLNWRMKI